MWPSGLACSVLSSAASWSSVPIAWPAVCPGPACRSCSWPWRVLAHSRSSQGGIGARLRRHGAALLVRGPQRHAARFLCRRRAALGLALPLGLALLAALAFAAFVVREARHPQPLISLSLFRDAGFAMTETLLSIAVNLWPFRRAAIGALLSGADRGSRGARRRTVLACAAVRHGRPLAWLAGKLAARIPIGRMALAGIVSQHRRTVDHLDVDASHHASPPRSVATPPGHWRRPVPGRLRRSRDRDLD